MKIPSTNPAHSNGNGAPNGLDANSEFIEELIGRCTENPGYVFTPEVIERMASLKQDERLTFETLRVRLKKMGFRLTALDDVIAHANIYRDVPFHFFTIRGFCRRCSRWNPRIIRQRTLNLADTFYGQENVQPIIWGIKARIATPRPTIPIILRVMELTPFSISSYEVLPSEKLDKPETNSSH